MTKDRLKAAVLTPLLAVSVFAGGAAGIAALASAQTPTTTDTTTTSAATTATTGAASEPQFDPSKGGHVGQNGTKEELLTGDTAAKVTAAALAANPGGTIERVET